MQQREYPYLTDEELSRMIKEIEGGEMIHMPSYLKGEILACVEEAPAKTERPKKQAFWLYSFRVSVAAAAAMLLVCFVPIQEVSVVDATWNNSGIVSSITQDLHEKSKNLCNALSHVSDRVLLGEKRQETNL